MMRNFHPPPSRAPASVISLSIPLSSSVSRSTTPTIFRKVLSNLVASRMTRTTMSSKCAPCRLVAVDLVRPSVADPAPPRWNISPLPRLRRPCSKPAVILARIRPLSSTCRRQSTVLLLSRPARLTISPRRKTMAGLNGAINTVRRQVTTISVPHLPRAKSTLVIPNHDLHLRRLHLSMSRPHRHNRSGGNRQVRLVHPLRLARSAARPLLLLLPPPDRRLRPSPTSPRSPSRHLNLNEVFSKYGHLNLPSVLRRNRLHCHTSTTTRLLRLV